MVRSFLRIVSSSPLSGDVSLFGAKNAALPILASLLLTKGTSTLRNVPFSSDIAHMIHLLNDLGAMISVDRENHLLTVDTSAVDSYDVCPRIMSKMRASIVVAGPLLSRFGKARVAFPGGCVIGARPIDLHVRGFVKLGAQLTKQDDYLHIGYDAKRAKQNRVTLEYPSVGATQNLMMFAVSIPGTTTIVNAAQEPEILDLVAALQKMGAHIICLPSNTIEIKGGFELRPIDHEILADRLEAGTLLLAAAISGGQVTVTNARADHLDLFLDKLEEMGHAVTVKGSSIRLVATDKPQAVSFKTGPYPGFPTDLQAPMMAAQCSANGVSVIEETVFENRLTHVKELQKLGAQIEVSGNTATVRGVDELYGASVIATDIRASCALALAGLVAQGQTTVTGMHHWKRAFDSFEQKLRILGGDVTLFDTDGSDLEQVAGTEPTHVSRVDELV